MYDFDILRSVPHGHLDRKQYGMTYHAVRQMELVLQKGGVKGGEALLRVTLV